MRIARFLVTPELLRQLLNLPRDTTILDAHMEGGDLVHRCIELTVEHPGLRDVPLTEPTPLVAPEWHRQEPVVFMTWNQE